MSSFGILAITPPSFEQREAFEPGLGEVDFRLADASIAIAATLCGETGIIDVEYVDLSVPGNVAALEKALLKMHGEGGTKYGVKASADQVELLKPIFKALTKVAETTSDSERVLVLTQDGAQALTRDAVKTAQSCNWTVLLECVSLAEALQAQEAAADGVIAKGHEAAGRVGEQTTFVLVQECVSEVKLPVFAEGGIGLHTAAACRAAGAAGVVLQSQLLLTRESRLPLEIKQKIATMDGAETSLLHTGDGTHYRVYARTGHDLIACAHDAAAQKSGNTIKSEILKFAALESSPEKIWLFGQDVCFAERFARKFASTAGVLQAIRESIDEHTENAKTLLPLAAGAPLAVSHGTKYPLVQGAMTRVSDCPEFALDVAKGGGLPFLALALMRKGEVEALVSKTAELLGSLAWGAGLLGFVPNELRQEQLEVILKYKPPFALIAGGRPDQAKQLEDLGIKTYLHVPSPLLLESFIEMGSRRFIFEGKECGGHVGPRSSFILWETMIEVLLRSVGSDAAKYHVLFAGGVHDGLSSAMVSAMAAPLAARGVKVGALMGTAYLFTEEAVRSGAIVKPFQDAALKCKQTVLLETGPGHAIRCIDSPYKRIFDNKRQELTVANKSREEIREELELMNLGRLRIASKGVNRVQTNKQEQSKDQIIADLKKDQGAPGQTKDLVSLSEKEQWQDGMYMIGQVASMHEKVTTIEKLHEDVCVQGSEILQTMSCLPVVEPVRSQVSVEYGRRSGRPSEPIAIVGMSCLFPKANDLETYWQNILDKVDTIEEVPLDQWDWREFYDKNPLAADKIVSKWGGFLKDIEFDPTIYGIPPSSLKSIDPMQVLLLEVTRAALADAGYTDRSFPKQKTSVILANAGHGPITALYSLRSMLGWKLSDLADDVKEHIKSKLPEWSEDSFPGYLGNVTAGRVANRFDLGGVNFSIDAACGSSLAALHVSMADLRNYNSDVVFLCASDTHNQPGDYLSFSKTHAFSAKGRCRTFDAAADGIVISEGMAMLVLKRLDDAERDGDKIYAVVRGVGGSSDGRDLSLTAPRPAGQVLAISRAFEDAGISPSTVSLVEAHGTGTVAGDKAEIGALKQVFDTAGARKRGCAVGSVKTMIGHTKAAAGLASLIKVAKALHHKVLPPTMGVTNPNPTCDFENSPFYVNSESRPWLNVKNDSDSEELTPRRAGVSAFGFGGTNFHAVLEEYVPKVAVVEQAPSKQWPAELFIIKSTSRAELFKPLSWLGEQAKKAAAQKAAMPASAVTSSPLKELAHLLHLKNLEKSGASRAGKAQKEPFCLTVVATSLEDLQEKLGRAKSDLLDTNKKQIKDPRGIYFFEPATDGSQAKVAFVFPGQGSQYVDMLKDVATTFPEVRKTLEAASSVLFEQLDKPLASYIFPPPSFTDQERTAHQAALTNTHIAQPAIGAADVAMLQLLQALNVTPDMVAGHSYGEYVALYGAGSLSQSDLFRISEIRGRILSEKKGASAGTMAAVSSDAAAIKKIMDKLSGITLANINSPTQCVISGELASIDNAVSVCKENGLPAKVIPVSQAFHSMHMGHAKEPLKVALDKLDIKSPTIPVYSNADAQVYPSEPTKIARKLSEHIVAPVDFVHEIQNMYRDGARIFVECGPNAVLTGLVTSILDEQKAGDYVALSVDRSGRHGVLQLLHALAQLAAAGVPVNTSILYRGRIDENQLFVQGNNQANAQAKRKLLYRVNGMKIERVDQTGSSLTGAKAPATATKAAPTASVGKSAAVQSTDKVTESSYMTDPAHNKNITDKSTQSSLKKDHGDSKLPVDTKTSHVAPQQPAASQGQFVQPLSAGTQANLQPTDGLYQGLPPTQLPQFGAAGNFASPVNNMQGVDQLMMHYQQVMLQMTNNFMLNQQQVMMGYLQGRMGQVQRPGTPAAYAGMPPSQFAPPQFPGMVASGLPNFQQAQNPFAVQNVQQPQQMMVPNASPFAAAASQREAVQSLTAAAQTAQSQAAARPTAEVEISDHHHNGNGNGKGNGNGNGNNGNGHVQMHATETAVSVSILAEPAVAEKYDAELLVAELLEIVSQRTGYPPDMLDPTLDLEADLGIDSIKRVEILNSFRKILPAAKQAQLESGIEELAGTKTLEGIIAWIRKEPEVVSGTAEATVATTENNGKHTELNVKINGEAVDFDISGKLGDSHGNGNGHGNGHGNGNGGHGNGNGNGKQTAKAALPDLDDLLAPANRQAIKSEMKRALVKVVPLPKLETKPTLKGTWVIAGDSSDLAETIQKQWQAAGAKAIVVRHGVASAPTKKAADLLNLEAVEQLLQEIRSAHGPVNGLVHCVAIDEADEKSVGTKSLFVLAKALDAEMSAAAGANSVVVVTKMGGAFQSGGDVAAQANTFRQAGAVGVLKSLAKEWSGVRCKAVDCAVDMTSDQIARAALEEATGKDVRTEIGRKASGERIGLDVSYAPLADSDLQSAQIDSSSVILITGGARGITAELAAELAEQFQPTLILVGRAEQPSREESAGTAGLTSAKELKAAIMNQLREQQGTVSIAAVEQIYQKLLRDREIRNNLRKLEQLGAKVHYRSVDVSEDLAFSSLIDELYKEFGKIDGVINGAGIIEDGFVKQKSPASFERVYDTKVNSASTLAKKIRLEKLHFMFLFSSVVGRTGNAGQTDYVAANEVVNKLAAELNKKTPARIASLMWGPWKGGMANPELESIFARYGWAMIAPSEGRKAFREELLAARKTDEEVILVAELVKDADTPVGIGARLHGIEAQRLNSCEHEFHLTLNPAQDVYLKDHTFDGVPVMPMAFALELMTEAVRSVYKDRVCVRVHNLDIPSGIVFDTNSKQISLTVSEQSRDEHTLMVEASLSISYPRKRTNFKAMFELVADNSANGSLASALEQIPEAVPARVKGLDELKALNEQAESVPTVSEIYSEYLFHGPLFQNITHVEACGLDGIVGRLAASDPRQCIPSADDQGWSIDPVLLDSAMQLAGVWVRKYLDITTLPTGFRKLHLLQPLSAERYYVRAFMDAQITANNLACHVAIYSEAGELVLLLESLGGVGSKSLNRLASPAGSTGSGR